MSIFKWYSRSVFRVGEVTYSVAKYDDKIRIQPALIRESDGSAKAIAYFVNEDAAKQFCKEVLGGVTEEVVG